MTYHGRYRSPEDLAGIYRTLDLVWAGDFMEAGHNSVWLLPNRIYEGGYYAVPSVAPAGTETAAWIEAQNVGFTLAEPLEEAVPKFLSDLGKDQDQLEHYKKELISKADETFVQPAGFLSNMIKTILGK